jgi:hypothetical protein
MPPVAVATHVIGTPVVVANAGVCVKLVSFAAGGGLIATKSVPRQASKLTDELVCRTHTCIAYVPASLGPGVHVKVFALP